jgi:hypothetical protein
VRKASAPARSFTEQINDDQRFLFERQVAHWRFLEEERAEAERNLEEWGGKDLPAEQRRCILPHSRALIPEALNYNREIGEQPEQAAGGFPRAGSWTTC